MSIHESYTVREWFSVVQEVAHAAAHRQRHRW